MSVEAVASGSSKPTHVSAFKALAGKPDRHGELVEEGQLHATARVSIVPGTFERAFQLAPGCSRIDELRSKLMREGCWPGRE